jgi:hypothetical protein
MHWRSDRRHLIEIVGLLALHMPACEAIERSARPQQRCKAKGGKDRPHNTPPILAFAQAAMISAKANKITLPMGASAADGEYHRGDHQPDKRICARRVIFHFFVIDFHKTSVIAGSFR